jgi:hypothetical protein
MRRDTMAKGRSREYARLEELLAEAGLCMPPMPKDAEARLKEREDACFSTRAFKESPVNMQHYVRKAITGVSPDYVLVARVGHGANAHAIQYFLVQGPLQVFLQLACGSQAGQDRTTTAVNECFALVHELVAAVPRALRSGRLPAAGRLTVVASDRTDSLWEIASAGERAGQAARPARVTTHDARTPRQALEAALGWCRGEDPSI